MFDPQTEYVITNKPMQITDFHKYSEEFVVRPPYQRKSVWSTRKQQALLDSLFRRYYIPRIVIREVRLSDRATIKEVIDGQQRIITVQEFLSNRLTLPKSLDDLHPDLGGRRYQELSSEVRRFVDQLTYDVDIVKQIDDPRNPDHQRVATEIFWRLQQGESLNYMEVAHSRLSSLSRNFVVKYADDQHFDYQTYRPIDSNPEKHPFFQVIDRSNDRMQHLALLTRLLILEEMKGPADVKNQDVMDYIDRYQRPDGIGNWSMEQMPHAKRTLSHMKLFYEVFADDPMVVSGTGMKEFSIEYFIISIYLLLRHLSTYYVFDRAEQQLFRRFVIDFHARWRDARRDTDTLILIFSDKRQQTLGEIELRDLILRQVFFDFTRENGHTLLTKDDRRAFTESERIKLYREQGGLCQLCLAENKPEKEALVPWTEYEVDHVLPHSKGGRTDLSNAQVLCRVHNRQKSNSVGNMALFKWSAETGVAAEQPTSTGKQAQDNEVSDRAARTRAPRGARTPEEAFRLPILLVLDDFGGSAKSSDVLAIVEELVADQLGNIDYELLKTGETRWRNTAAWCRQTLVDEGLLRNDSRRGIWEISDKGREYLKQHG